MLILSFIFLLCNAETFRLERKQFDSLQCLSGDGCHLVEQIQWFACQGETNHSLACHTNLHYTWKLRNLLIQCNDAMDHCSAEFTLRHELPFVPLIFFEFFSECVANFLRIITLGLPFRFVYPWHIDTTPNAVLIILQEEFSFLQRLSLTILFIFCACLIFFVHAKDKEMRSRGVPVEKPIQKAVQPAQPLPKPIQQPPLDLPNNVKLTYFFATEAVKREMIHDLDMLQKFIRYCTDEFCSANGGIELSLDCEKMIHCGEPRLKYQLQLGLPKNISLTEDHIKLLKELYPIETKSIILSCSARNNLILEVELISPRASTEIKSE